MEQSGRILIVDDMPQNIKVLGALLRKEGYAIEVALSGQEALEWTKELSFDLILLDIMMPEMDGYEVCRHLKANAVTAKIPVVFLTAKFDSDSVVAGFKAGAVDYVTKPFATEELLARVKTHLDLQRHAKELEALNVAKDKFFSIIAHDLVNPFHALLGFTDVLKNSYSQFTDAERLELIDMVHQGAKNGYKLLSGLLEWSRQNLQKSSLKFREFGLAETAREVIESIKYTAHQKGIGLWFDIPEGLTLMADHEVTKIIIRNLMSNSIKFTPPQGSVTLSAVDSGQMVTLSVTDTGIGISEEVIPTLFRLDKPFTNQGTEGEIGTGLGLVLCHDFVKAHGGEIWVESQTGLGTTFSFTLPKGGL